MFGERQRKSEPEGEKKAVKCDLCQKLPQNDSGTRAACVASCPTGAIVRGNPRKLVDFLRGVSEDG